MINIQGIIASVMVTDIDRAIHFYRDKLGLTVENEQADWVMFREGIALQLSPVPAADLKWDPNSVVITLVVSDCEEAYRQLTERGVAFLNAPTGSPGLTAVASLRDSENNILQLLQL
jgi:predicted enzyme related to lactoylglutathione lyase